MAGLHVASGKNTLYRAIGAGTCGKVFEHAGTNSVLKLANTVDDSGLWNDYKMHARVAKAISDEPSTFYDLQIPRIYYYARSCDEKWWDEYGDNLPEKYRLEPRSVLCTERIPPLPTYTRNFLIDEFCPENIKGTAQSAPANKDCLARVYLGNREEKRTKPLTAFSLRNFNLNLDRIDRLGLQGIEDMANLMGRVLAVMHWEAGTDADDVEFVSGSSPTYFLHSSLNTDDIASLPNTPQSTWKEDIHNSGPLNKQLMTLWLLDFNRCKDITRDEAGVIQAVRSFFRNDLYFPRPKSKLWENFVEGYMSTSNRVLQGENDDEVRELPQQFIRECVAEQERRLVAKEEAEKRLAGDVTGD